MKQSKDPIVILGGFLSSDRLYAGFQNALCAFSRRPVWVVPTRLIDWLPGTSQQDWARILEKLDRTVREALRQSGSKRVTLIGHSAGGVLARLYLSPDPLLGQAHHGLERVSHLITLGSPHFNRGGLTQGGQLSRWVQSQVPNTAFEYLVHYTSVAGKFIQGKSDGKLKERFAAQNYRRICGNASAWGDGLIPVTAALLPGSNQIILDGVSHYALFGRPWYGDPAALPYWWDQLTS